MVVVGEIPTQLLVMLRTPKQRAILFLKLQDYDRVRKIASVMRRTAQAD